MSQRFRWTIVVSILTLAGVSPVSAIEPADLCAGNPCVVSGSISIQESVQLDFGDSTELRFAMGTRIMFPQGQSLGLRAGSIVVEPGVFFRSVKPVGDAAGTTFLRLEATTGDLTIGSAEGRATIEVQDPGGRPINGKTSLVSDSGNVWINARINLDGEQGATADLLVQARNNTTVRGKITANGGRGRQGMGTDGGSVWIEAGDGTLRVDAAISVKGRNEGFGGRIWLEGGQGAELAGAFNASSGGGEGGEVVMLAGGDLATAAKIRSNAGYEYGDGGSIAILVEGSVSLAGPMVANCGRSREMCWAGQVDVEAGNDVIQEHRGRIAARGAGRDSDGGEVYIVAGRNVRLDRIDVGGAVYGGEINATAAGTLDVVGTLRAVGRGGEYSDDGRISLTGECGLTVAGTGRVVALRARKSLSGEIDLETSGGELTIAGRVKASDEVNLRYTQGFYPQITGTVVPEPRLLESPTAKCVGPSSALTADSLSGRVGDIRGPAPESAALSPPWKPFLTRPAAAPPRQWRAENEGNRACRQSS